MSYRSIIPETTGGTPGYLLGAVKGQQVAAEPAAASLAAPELLRGHGGGPVSEMEKTRVASTTRLCTAVRAANPRVVG